MRVFAHVDLDAFYTQVEVQRDPQLRGQPLVVVQYNPYGDLSTLRPSDNRIFPDSNGSIIAVSYEARAAGVKRNMMAQAARKLCPGLIIVQVPVAHGKADLTIYRDAGAAVLAVLSAAAVTERASIDEAYLDVTAAAQQLLSRTNATTATTATAGVGGGAPGLCTPLGAASLQAPSSFEGWHVAGEAEGADGAAAWWCRPHSHWTQGEAELAAGALHIAALRRAVTERLGYTCSAGIGHSKLLAKLGSGLHKPAQQTLVPHAAVPGLLAPLPLTRLRSLGGKYGEEIATTLRVTTVGELAALPLARLETALGSDAGGWLWRLARGEDGEDVRPRTLPKSLSAGKTFRGNHSLTALTAVHGWLCELAQELQERVQADRRDNQRLPSLLTVTLDVLTTSTQHSSDVAGAGGGGSGAAAAAAGSSGGGGVGGRSTPQTWRAGSAAVSRSVPLGRPVAKQMADEALKLVKRWSRERGAGWQIVGLFLAASNFVAAPTGTSTLDRFVVQQAGGSNSRAGTSSSGAAAGAAHPTPPLDILQQERQQQQQEGHQQQREPQSRTACSALLPAAGSKRQHDAASAGGGGLPWTQHTAAAKRVSRGGQLCVQEAFLRGGQTSTAPPVPEKHQQQDKEQWLQRSQQQQQQQQSEQQQDKEPPQQQQQQPHLEPVCLLPSQVTGSHHCDYSQVSQVAAVASLHDWLPRSQQQQQQQSEQLTQQQQQHQHQIDAGICKGAMPPPGVITPGVITPATQQPAQPAVPLLLRAEDIDPAVLAELPLDIQAELRRELRARAAAPLLPPTRTGGHSSGSVRTRGKGDRAGAAAGAAAARSASASTGKGVRSASLSIARFFSGKSSSPSSSSAPPCRRDAL